jgi:hypothetical protein
VETTLEYARKNKIDPGDVMICVPISFAEHVRAMIQNLQALISDGDLRISHTFSDLIMDLRVAKIKQHSWIGHKSAFDLLL